MKALTLKNCLTFQSTSYLYLLLPWIIFILGWLRPEVALPILSLVLFASYRFLLDLTPPQPVQTESRKTLLAIALIALVWVCLSGAGGMGYQNWPDWRDKTAILKDLTQFSWPVTYRTNQFGDASPTTLVYYFALYLPAAVIGKMMGWKAAQMFLLLTIWLGTFLSLVLFSRLVGQRKILAAGIFVFFSGMDILGKWIVDYALPADPTSHIEWWSGFAQYSSNTTLMFWVPQHALGAWIVSSLIFDQALEKRNLCSCVWLVAIAALWSPYVALGLVPLLIMVVLMGKFKGVFTFQNTIASAALGGVLALFYSAAASGQSGSTFFDINQATWGRYALFLFIEFGAAALVLLPWVFKQTQKKSLIAVFVLSVGALSIFAATRMGYGNFTLRASIPPLFCLWVLMARGFFETKSAWSRIPIALVFLIGCATPLTEIARSVTHYHVGPYELGEAVSVNQLDADAFNRLFMHPVDSAFMHYLAKTQPKLQSPSH